MNKQEIKTAIEDLTNLADCIELTSKAFAVVHGENLKLGVQALEKQIPKKPSIVNGHNACPYEDCLEKILRYYQYCPECGQAIDWSVEE